MCVSVHQARQLITFAALSAQSSLTEALNCLELASLGQRLWCWIIPHSILLWRKALFESIRWLHTFTVGREARMGLLATEEQAQDRSVGG